MAITRWDPFRDLVALQERMNRMFEDTMSTQRPEADIGANWAPSVDIYETEDSLVLKVELPEIRKEDLDIQVEGGVMTIRGERQFDQTIRKENYHKIERSYGTFSRSFALPSNVDPEKINAAYKDGVLMISISKRAESKKKQIQIS